MSELLRRYYREILSREKGTVFKDWGGKISFCLVFPNNYRMAISNLGFQFVYWLLNSMREVVCERAFLPDSHVVDELLRTRTLLSSLESMKPLDRFDIVAFSLPYENDYPNVLKILSLGGVPLLSEQRREEDPLVIAGGSAISLNPEPMAPFFDCVLIGEAEEILPDFLKVYQAERDLPREKLLEVLATVPGVYVPSLYEPRWDSQGKLKGLFPKKEGIPDKVQRRYHRGDPPVVSSPLRSDLGEFGDATIVEVARGCPYKCKFCAIKPFYGPFRPRTFERLKQEVGSALKEGKKLALLGAAVASHPQLEEVCTLIVEGGGSFSLSSLRAERVSEKLAQLLSKGGQRTATLAPESGSATLREKIGKKMSDQSLLDAISNLIRAGVYNLKLYFMVGLPGEKDEDIRALLSLVKRIRDMRKALCRGEKGTMTVTISPFVPKPWTPFQWSSFSGLESLKGKLRTVKRELKSKGIRVYYDLPKWSYMEALFSLGDRRIGWALFEGIKEDKGVNWLRDAPFNPDYWVMRQKERSERFPWDLIDFGLSPEELWKEYEETFT